MTLRTDPQGQLSDLVGALTRAAPGSRPGGDPVEASPAAVAGIDTPQGTRLAAAGVTAMFDADRTPLEDGHPQVAPVDPRTFFDLASVTKVVTALTAATLVDEGVLDLEAPISEHLPSPHPALTARHLLTHTSGLPPVLPLWRSTGPRAHRLSQVHEAELVAPPGSAHAYSCIGFILLGLLMEALTSHPLPVLAAERVLTPAGAHTARWAAAPHAAVRLPAPEGEAGARPVVAATEHQQDPDRGLVQGSTHDETAWSLGGVGNAGLFATVHDTLAIGRVLAGRASPRLSPEVRTLLTTDQLPSGVTTSSPWRQGLGLRVGHETKPGTLEPQVVGHPGFTGTSVLADPDEGTVAVLLTNRVHPVRTRFTVEASRRQLARLAFS